MLITENVHNRENILITFPGHETKDAPIIIMKITAITLLLTLTGDCDDLQHSLHRSCLYTSK